MKVAYFIPQFPRLTETFIRREVEDLSKREDLLVKVFAVEQEKKPDPDLRELVSYWHPSPLQKILDFFSFFFSHPVRFFDLVIKYGRQPKALLNGVSLGVKMRTFSPDLLFVHFIAWPADLGAVVADMLGIKWGISAHAKDIFFSSPRALRRRVQAADFVVTCTGYNRNYLCNRVPGENHRKIHKIYHGLETDIFSGEEVNRDNQKIKIISVGRLVEKKGFSYLLQASALLKEAGYDFSLEIYGGGPLRENLGTEISRLDLENIVELRGRVPFEEVRDAYLSADIFALACVRAESGDMDGLPNVILEAQLAGLPVVSTRVSGIPEGVVEGETAFLVEPRDSRALSQALLELIEDSKMRKVFGQAGREYVRNNFAVHENVGKLAKLFRKVSLSNG
ncbi:MAG: glycosyltransferase family 4 protein [Patescibacteria group bacterium]